MELTLQISQKVWKNIKPTKEGYTHDWIVMVQGLKGDKIKHIVEKVVFHLPDIYPDNKRIKKEPPFLVSDSTSQRLCIQIDVFFPPELQCKEESCIYEILISGDENLVTKKLEFPIPSIAMIEKILLAGGDLGSLEDQEFVEAECEEVFQIAKQTSPVLTRKVVKVEPQDDVQIAKAVEEATLNTAKENGNLQNKCNLSSEAQLRYDEMLEENRKLKEVNRKLKEKIALQEKIIAYYEEQFAYYEAYNLGSQMALNLMMKKLEDYKREISALQLELQMLEAKAMKIPPGEIENDG